MKMIISEFVHFPIQSAGKGGRKRLELKSLSSLRLEKEVQ